MGGYSGRRYKSLQLSEFAGYALTLVLGLQLCMVLPGTAQADDAVGANGVALAEDASTSGWFKKGFEECFDPYHFGLLPGYDAAHAALNPPARRYFWNVPVGAPVDDSFLMLSLRLPAAIQVDEVLRLFGVEAEVYLRGLPPEERTLAKYVACVLMESLARSQERFWREMAAEVEVLARQRMQTLTLDKNRYASPQDLFNLGRCYVDLAETYVSLARALRMKQADILSHLPPEIGRALALEPGPASDETGFWARTDEERRRISELFDRLQARAGTDENLLNGPAVIGYSRLDLEGRLDAGEALLRAALRQLTANGKLSPAARAAADAAVLELAGRSLRFGQEMCANTIKYHDKSVAEHELGQQSDFYRQEETRAYRIGMGLFGKLAGWLRGQADQLRVGNL